MTTESRTLHDALLEYLFPKNGPIADVAKGYGADELTRHLAARLPASLQRQLIRLCDLSPVGAVELINFTINVSDESFEAGRDDAMNSEIPEAEERGRKEERKRIRVDWLKVLEELDK